MLLVDKRVGLEEGYDFPPDGPYTLLEQLFSAKIPPGTTDLEDADIRVRRISAPPEGPKPGETPPQ